MGLGRREAYAAEARLLHLKGNVADALPVDFGSPALAGGFKRLDDHHAAARHGVQRPQASSLTRL